MARPPRIEGFDYVGFRAYFLTICTRDRIPMLGNADVARSAIDRLLQIASDYRFLVIVHCFMPDHVHAIVEGQRADSDFRKFVPMFKQRAAFDYRRRTGRRLWQKGYFDRVVRDEERMLGIAAYIVHNPVRAGLCRTPDEYPFLGSGKYTIGELVDAVQIRPWGRRRRP